MIVLVVVATAVSPAGPAVGAWIRDAIGRERVVGVPQAQPALVTLPVPSRLLVASGKGIWVVHKDGSRRFLGAYQGASWSPRGLFVVAWGGEQLVALEPSGTNKLRWSLSRERVADARWAPGGYRVAYRSGSALRVVAGDGTGDVQLARPVAPVAPAWRPGTRNVLAYVDRSRRIVVVDADSREVLWKAIAPEQPLQLEWTTDGSQLLVTGAQSLHAFEASGRPLTDIRIPQRLAATTAAAIRPGTHQIAYATFSERDRAGSVFLYNGSYSRLLFSGSGRFDDLVWSPEGRFVLVGWGAADQWLFIPLEGGPRVLANANIAGQFDPGAVRAADFPRVEGWTVDSSS